MVIPLPICSIIICADFSTGINDYLEENQHLLLPDLSDDYLQIEVDPKLGDLLTINTHRGLSLYMNLRNSSYGRAILSLILV